MNADSPMVFQRTLPRPDDLNRFYWSSGEDGKLRIQRCKSCRHWQHPASPVCSKCYSKDLEPEVVSGRGTVFSFTINAKAWAPGMDVPYVIAVVTLEEQDGLQITTNLRDVDPRDVRVGMPVEVTFEHDEDIWLPMFKPASA